MKRLYASHNTLELEQIGHELTGAGIKFVMRNMNRTGQAAGEIPPIVCWPEIWVTHDEELPPAKRILARVLEELDNPGIAWTCPDCGERLEGQFGSCWRCAGNPGEA